MVFYGAFISPPEHLKPYVRYYRTLRANLNNVSAQPVTSYPDGTVDLIFSFGQSVEREIPTSEASHWRGAWLVGPSMMVDKYAFENEIDLLNVSFYPIGAYLVLGIPMHELRNKWVNLKEIWSQEADTLIDNLYESDVGNRISILNTLLTKRLLDASEINEDIQRAMALINAHQHYTIHQIHNKIGISERSLQRLFRTYIGISPQASVTLQRFCRALNLITDTQQPLSEIALMAGFYDQPQMNRTFARIAGLSPLQYLAAKRHVGIVQDNEMLSRLNDK